MELIGAKFFEGKLGNKLPNLQNTKNVYPPIPDLWGLTSPVHRSVVTVASTAFPPLSSTDSPRSEQTPTSDATAPDAPTYIINALISPISLKTLSLSMQQPVIIMDFLE